MHVQHKGQTLSGFYAFLVGVYFIGAMAIVNLAASGELLIDDAWRCLGLLTVGIIGLGIFSYGVSIAD